MQEFWNLLLILKGPAKNASENVCLSHLLHMFAKSIEKCKYMYRGKKVWIDIRLLLLQEQSDLNLHCLTKKLLKHFSRLQKQIVFASV